MSGKCCFLRIATELWEMGTDSDIWEVPTDLQEGRSDGVHYKF